ncbi:hypothetical protein HanPI659440_Chr12g0459051 [Helianthus annuus]|uniref:ATPase inhibitor n=1 Tax=Helianthus annuus TaxID=4232 RepID=A0A251T397_HELAN|nr:uncharacterized protein At2g27730, mitochondrial [Helianthus annuus]KAF5777816.1 hypothetical protein HanXRQr2_Chr12g0540101 [Helianthus annuus]KAJ0489302.1 hypothetical protein HanHA300_Chr12g0442431 [Helianthus annuus]KAJ0674865.1 hypothetical protein HanLR1_Chr12g0444661 [Helianthus annuus]KAJ0678219.1 hypothetical protein HanOQP8_Chr12g0445321 [Helianthus annuus]KAJ0725469.1 hypothetical protein HanPI659440_Chr12g0459051 [Helianthus annuus]
MAMRSTMTSRASLLLRAMDSSSSRSSYRFFSDQGRVLSEEERAAENVYIKKMEKERLEKQKLKAEKEKAKAEKENAEKKP